MHKTALLGAFFLACCAQPTLAQDDSREAAQNALNAGEASRAVSILEEEVEQSPRDPDLLRRLASAYAADQNHPAALEMINRAMEIAPEDNDIRLARARILLWSERPEEAMTQAELVALSNPQYPELDEVLQSIRSFRAPGQRGGIGLSSGISQIDLRSGVSSTWERVSADGFIQFDDVTAAATIEHEERRVSDTRMGIRIDRRTSFGSLYIGGAVTPSADFREKWSISGGGVFRLANNFMAVMNIRHSHYKNSSVASLQPGISIEAIPSLTLTGRSILLIQSDRPLRAGASLRADYRLPSTTLLFMGGAVYPDTEAGITRQVQSLSAGASLPLTDSLALRLSGEYDRRRQSYIRKALTLGISWRFGR